MAARAKIDMVVRRSGARQLWQSARSRRVRRRLAGPKLMRAFAETYPAATFVEIGSNDGEQHDHLRPFILSRAWSGVMVEPVPYVFERLARNYQHVDRVSLVNAAVADRDGVLPFFHLVDATDEEREALPSWYDGIGSFSRDAVLSHSDRIPDIEQRIVSTQVPSLTFESLCRQYGVSGLDLLLIDVEGYDWEILKTLDFETYRPRLVVYEHYHLSPPDRKAASDHLHSVGYETMAEGFDTFCLQGSPEDRLLRVWRSLRPAVAAVSVHDDASS